MGSLSPSAGLRSSRSRAQVEAPMPCESSGSAGALPASATASSADATAVSEKRVVRVMRRGSECCSVSARPYRNSGGLTNALVVCWIAIGKRSAGTPGGAVPALVSWWCVDYCAGEWCRAVGAVGITAAGGGGGRVGGGRGGGGHHGGGWGRAARSGIVWTIARQAAGGRQPGARPSVAIV